VSCYASMKRVLVTGATGQIGSEVIAQLRGTGCRIRAMTRNPRSANVPDVEVVPGDLSAPDTLDACLEGIDSVFLLWIAPLAAAAPALERIAAHAAQVVLLTSPHKTRHPFFQQPNALRVIHAGVEQLIEASGLRWTFLRPGPFAINCRNWWAPQLRNGNVVRGFTPTQPPRLCTSVTSRQWRFAHCATRVTTAASRCYRTSVADPA
jgi:uncharacterized protein YbjT (DUF2867 family)